MRSRTFYANSGAIILLLVILSCKDTGHTASATKIVQEEKRPNVVFISVDDLRPELGVYGNNIIKTPNMDKLASNGAYFTNHYVQVPTCGASRYSLMTGLRPREKRHLGNDIFAKETAGRPEKTTPESFVHQLKRNGYYTVGIGKLSHSPDGLVYGYEEPMSEKWEMPHSWDEMLFDHGKWGTGWNAFFGYANGENRQSLRRQVTPYESADVDAKGYPDGLTTDLAISKLQQLKDKKRPFFLGIGFFKPHLPFNAPKEYWDLYDRETMPIAPDPFVPKNVNIASLHNSSEFNGYKLTDEVVDLTRPLSKEYSKKLVHGYYAAVSYIDDQIGRVVDEIKALGLEENTIIVLWGDHGWHLGNDLVWGKHSLFERALKSVLIVKVPGQNVMKNEITSIQETVDIYPTLLELCDVTINHEIDGASFASLLKTKNSVAKGSDPAYGYFRQGITMRTDRYRLTKYFRNEKPTIELYDHQIDPDENENIASENPEIVDKLMVLFEKGDTGLYAD